MILLELSLESFFESLILWIISLKVIRCTKVTHITNIILYFVLALTLNLFGINLAFAEEEKQVQVYIVSDASRAVNDGGAVVIDGTTISKEPFSQDEN